MCLLQISTNVAISSTSTTITVYVESSQDCPTLGISGALSPQAYGYVDGLCLSFPAQLNALHAYSEASPCANRGIPDPTTGECQCFTGYKGLTCENQDALT